MVIDENKRVLCGFRAGEKSWQNMLHEKKKQEVNVVEEIFDEYFVAPVIGFMCAAGNSQKQFFLDDEAFTNIWK